tara:strand:- start:2556 stop:3854 length:1299 start_codon:yes stop_codon:yes gene_type:complete
MIDFLIRLHNESIWIPQLLRSIQNQKGNLIGEILLLDNNSNDNPKELISQFPTLNISYLEYKKKYFPGEMLNYGINFLQKKIKENNTKDSFICILSAHCFFDDEYSLLKFYKYINSITGCRAGFGRQVPMTISDAQAIRDLVLLYPKENRIIKTASAFNNAFSLIRNDALKQNLFSNEVTNLEDVIWADNELKKGFKIAYCADSEIVHHHGPHHANSSSRLENTKKTISNNSEIFNIKLRKAFIIPNEIISIFAGYNLKDELIDEARIQARKRKIIIWSTKNYKDFFDKKETSNIIWIKRNEFKNAEVSIYEEFNDLYNQILEINNNYNFFVLFDNSININFSLITPSSAAKIISENFGNIIWPAIYSKKLIFSDNGKGEFISNQQYTENKWVKNDQLEVLRGNGTILSRAALQNPLLMFEKPFFHTLKKNA